MTTPSGFVRARLAIVACVAAVALLAAACVTTGTKKAKRKRRLSDKPVVVAVDPAQPGEPTPPPEPPPEIDVTDVVISFVDAKAGPVGLGARVTGPRATEGPVVVIVPGGGDVNKEGTRKGDGVVVYDKPIDVGTAWAQALATRGATVVSYDKRTCGPNDVASCKKNPQNDVDEEGPVALKDDVDAACAFAKALPTFDGHLILWAHGQAGQVALSSTCAASASALVLAAPIPRAIDVVLTDALLDRHKLTAEQAKSATSPAKEQLLEQSAALKNLAGTRAAEFTAMKAGKFAKDARVGGATTAFWLGWIELTERTPQLVKAHADKVVVVVGSGDQQLSALDRAAAQKLPAKKVVVVDADHHLLSGGALGDDVVDAVLAAIDDVLAEPES